jgi:hypothetical protein
MMIDFSEDNFSEAIREAYASAPVDKTVLATLELWHPSFDVPVRVVHDEGVLLEADPEEIWGRRFTLEADAPRDGGGEVIFLAAAFEAQQPAAEENQPPEMIIRINNVDELLMEALDKAVETSAKIEAIYREYFPDAPDTVQFLLTDLSIKRVAASMLRIEGTAGFTDLFNVGFPNAVYTPQEHPSLAQ